MSGSVAKRHTLLKMTENSNTTRKSMYGSFSQSYRPLLPVQLQEHLQHRYRRVLTGEVSTPSPDTVPRRSTRSRVLGDELHHSEQKEDNKMDIDSVFENWLPQALLVNLIRHFQE